jgi:hypothetical protein
MSEKYCITFTAQNGIIISLCVYMSMILQSYAGGIKKLNKIKQSKSSI